MEDPAQDDSALRNCHLCFGCSLNPPKGPSSISIQKIAHGDVECGRKLLYNCNLQFAHAQIPHAKIGYDLRERPLGDGRVSTVLLGGILRTGNWIWRAALRIAERWQVVQRLRRSIKGLGLEMVNIALLDARKSRSVLKRLIEDYDYIQIAVAWGYNGKLADLLMENSGKFRSVTFGLNGFATSPDLVERLIGIKNAFIAKADNGIFHPKLYLFLAGGKAEAIVGSANFTRGGLDRNHEACVHIEGPADADIFKQIQRELSGYEMLRQCVTQPLADSYRRQYDAARRQQGQRDPILPNEKNGRKGLTSPLAMMSWEEFATDAKNDPHHDFERRMKLLREIQRLFASVERFSDLTATEWKGIAGTLGKSERIAAGLDIHEWGWFGSMGGNGDFAGLVSRQDRQLSDAVDCIPRKDPVTRERFEEYCRRFRKAFMDADAHHVGEFPTATRLLAMKRPDTFVCANGKNKGNLAKALNFAPTTLSLANYWDRIIVPIQSSPWYNAPHPSGGDGELWDYRVAMLDTHYYDKNA